MKWKEVVGMKGLYIVSDSGIIKRTETGHVLKPQVNHKGYLQVAMHRDGKIVTDRIHRIVAKAFIENPNQLPQVNHIDANKQNNNVSNLEWITNEDNMRHARLHGCYKPFNQNQYESVINNLKYAQEKKRKAVQCLDMNGNLLKEFKSITEAERMTGANNSKIVSCCKGRRKSTHNLKWRYKV